MLFLCGYLTADEVWLRQQAPGGWRKHPLAVEALSRYVLSPDCCDLLDGLLEMDEVGCTVGDRRASATLSASQVLAHPWLKQTLLPDQQQAGYGACLLHLIFDLPAVLRGSVLLTGEAI